MTKRIGVDIGGTFTDVVLYDEENGELFTTKSSSTPPNFEQGVVTGIEKILDRTGVAPGEVTYLSHGTTVGTNAVLEGEFPAIGLITNEGLRDVLEIGDQTRPEVYNLQVDKPPELVPRYLRKEIPGRIDSEGELVDSLDEDRAATAIDELIAEDVDAIVVSMLFSYLNDDHEQRVGELIEERRASGADVGFALSSRVHPEIREYDRTITTVLNEAVKTTIREYIENLDEAIVSLGINVPLNVMHTGGGIFDPDQAVEYAVRTILSGPVAGAVAAQDTVVRDGFDDAIGIDMGGTSADVSIVRGGDLIRTTESEINNLPVKTPMVDVSTVGAGGGSIAWIDDGGALRVGPRSAGSTPGPICYGNGGTEPTITDANLLLGRLNPEYFLGGEMDLIVDETRKRFAERIAKPLDQSVEEAALDVLDVAVASLAREIRAVTVERGDDPREFCLVAFGGAGPLHAANVAKAMDMETVLIPRNPGVFSAQGLLVADVRIDESHYYRSDVPDPELMTEQFSELETRIAQRFPHQAGNPENIAVERSVDVRYDGQAYELTVPVHGGPLDANDLAATIERFHDKHDRLYEYAMRDEDIEFVALRATGRYPTPPLSSEGSTTGADPVRGKREVYFPTSGKVPAQIYERTALEPGTEIAGPAVLEEHGSTTIVPEDAAAAVSEEGSIIITL
jgi:N-methylhydantoinase A